MLINLRNALMTSKRLPYDAEVEYLQSSGTQWINTGVTPTPSDSTRIVADLSLTSINTGDNNIIFGSYIETPTVRQFAFVDRTAKARIAYVGAASGTVTVATGTDYLFEAQFAAGNSYLNVNGATSSQNTSTATVLPTQPMALFACRYADSVISPTSMRLRSCKIYLNGVLVRDYIPVRKGTVGYLYDRVSGKLFGNAGTGDFVLGSDVVPVEWLEAPGSDTYIMTGVTPAESSTVDFELNIGFAPSSSGARYIIGDGQASKNHYSSITAADKFGAGSAVTATTLQAATMYNAKTSITSSGITFYITVGGAEESFKTTSYPSATYGEFMLFRRAYNALGTGGARMKFAVMNVNGITMRKFYAVRVGTEGAMMDVLTRRIYRNAGTGAFGYGNDLKYPIPAS